MTYGMSVQLYGRNHWVKLCFSTSCRLICWAHHYLWLSALWGKTFNESSFGRPLLLGTAGIFLRMHKSPSSSIFHFSYLLVGLNTFAFKYKSEFLFQKFQFLCLHAFTSARNHIIMLFTIIVAAVTIGTKDSFIIIPVVNIKLFHERLSKIQ